MDAQRFRRRLARLDGDMQPQVLSVDRASAVRVRRHTRALADERAELQAQADRLARGEDRRDIPALNALHAQLAARCHCDICTVAA